MSQPLFTIITVTYNAEKAIVPTLRSVGAQTYDGEIEYLVIDGASSDNTLELVKNSGIRGLKVVSEPDNGLYDAMNKGQSMARGEYLIFLNAGDTFHAPDTLAHIARAIEENERPGLVYGQTVFVEGDDRHVIGMRHLTAPEVLTYQSFADGMMVCHQAMCVLKRITSPYDTRYRFSADYDWAIKVLQHSRKNIYLPEIVIDYQYEGLTTRNQKSSLTERFRIMSYYYGITPTLLRHVKFAFRSLRRRLKPNNNYYERFT